MDNSVAEVQSMPIVDSPTILVFDDCLSFDPFACADVEAAISGYAAIAGSINRCSLYFAYSMGKLYDVDKLRKVFGVKNIQEVANMLHVSVMTLWRYKQVHSMLTPAQVKQLASRMISINAVLKLADLSKDYPDEAKKLLDAMMSGELSTVKDIDGFHVKELETRLRPYNLLPGGTPDDASDSEVFDGQRLLAVEADKSAAQRIAELNGESIVEEFPDEPTEDKASQKSDEKKNKVSTIVDEDDTQNKRDIRSLMRDCRGLIAAVRRDLKALHNLREQMDTLHDRAAVIMGDGDMFNEYNDLLEGLYDDACTAVEILVPEVQRGIEHGLLNRKCLLPESADTDKIFRKED